jgi:hypothetical protein
MVTKSLASGVMEDHFLLVTSGSVNGVSGVSGVNGVNFFWHIRLLLHDVVHKLCLRPRIRACF